MGAKVINNEGWNPLHGWHCPLTDTKKKAPSPEPNVQDRGLCVSAGPGYGFSGCTFQLPEVS